MPALSKREHIISQALTLFYQHGFHATGIDRIISEAGVSKKTLYNHFRSKDELVLATLRKRDELFRNFIMGGTERIAHTPLDKLSAIFDVIADWFMQKDFSGCMFINASAEFPNPESRCHAFCAEHKHLVREYILELAVKAKTKEPEELSKKLCLLIEGAIVHAYVENDKDAAKRAKEMAEVFIGLAVPSLNS